MINFNPRSPYGERLSRTVFWRQYQRISIHAPLTGSDLKTAVTSQFTSLFQSTLPLRGATKEVSTQDVAVTISIHAPLTGSDKSSAGGQKRPIYFNPRSPYGERHGFLSGDNKSG